MKHKITLDGETITINPESDQNLLLSMELKGLPVNIGCTVGVCEVCKLKVIEGKENIYEINEHLYDLEPNEILPCCVKIKGDVVLEKNF